MSDKYSRPINTRLLIVALFAIGVFYGVSHIPTKCTCHEQAGHGHHDAQATDGGHEAHGEDGHAH